MTTRPKSLSEKDHRNMDQFLAYLIQDIKSSAISEQTAASVLAHVIAAVDIGNYEEARNWFQQGRKFVHDTEKLREMFG
jgi:hypothetical protein